MVSILNHLISRKRPAWGRGRSVCAAKTQHGRAAGKSEPEVSAASWLSGGEHILTEQHLRAIFETSPDCIKVVAPDGTLLHMNAAGLSMIEVDDARQVIGRNAYCLVAPEDLERYRVMNERVCAGSKQEIEFQMIGLRGTRRWLESHAVPIRDSKTGMLLQLSVTHDITQRKQAELEQQKLISLIEQSPNFIGVASLNQEAFFVNRFGRKLVGLDSMEEVRQTKILDYLSEEEQARIETEILPIVKATGYWEGELHVKHFKTGALIPFVANMFTIPDAVTGEPAFLACVCTDITERKRAEQIQAAIAIENAKLYQTVQRELADREQSEAYVRYQKDVLEQIIQGASLSSVLESLTDSLERFAYRDLIATILLMQPDGRTLFPAAGRRCPHDWSRYIQGLPIGPEAGSCGTAAYHGRQVIVSDIATDPLWAKYKDVALKYGLRACWSTPIFSSSGKVLGTFAIYYLEPATPTDQELQIVEIVTRTAAIAIERKQSDEALRESRIKLQEHAEELERRVDERTAKLREAVTEMEEFSYSVSHDLRAPVRAMQGYARALLMDYADRLDDEGRNYLGRIMRAGERMDKLIMDVLTFSRLGRSHFQLQRVSLEKLVHEIIHQYPNLQSPRAEITVEPLLNVIGHEPSLTQAISNLLGNAVKFVGDNSVPKVRVRTEQRGPDVRLLIQDNGIGISSEHQERIFGMFERIHPDKTYEGTGIGLAVVRKAVERMGGSVGIESNGVDGSTFWIQLRKAE